jgi:uncharacterized protein (DUF302 family)
VTTLREALVSYYIAKQTTGSFDETIDRVKEVLSSEGFGVLTEIDVKATMKEKLGEDFRDYRILGACNPPFAHKALSAEDKIGTMLPCNVIVQSTGSNSVEIAAVDPVASMAAVDNQSLAPIAEEIRSRLARVIEQV